MPPTITRAQRDAIYEAVMTHLSGIGDVWIAVQDRDFATAKRMGRKFAEDLRLLDDLGWDDTTEREAIALTMPPGELTSALARLHADAAGSLDAYLSRPKEEEEAIARRDVTASAALGALLGQMAGRQEGDRSDDREEDAR